MKKSEMRKRQVGLKRRKGTIFLLCCYQRNQILVSIYNIYVQLFTHLNPSFHFPVLNRNCSITKNLMLPQKSTYEQKKKYEIYHVWLILTLESHSKIVHSLARLYNYCHFHPVTKLIVHLGNTIQAVIWKINLFIPFLLCNYIM